MHVQGVRPHLGTWTQAIRCGNWSCRRIVPMVVPFGAVSMDAPDPRRAPFNSPVEGIRAHPARSALCWHSSLLVSVSSCRGHLEGDRELRKRRRACDSWSETDSGEVDESGADDD